MSENVTLIRVFGSSPSDVAEERESLEKVVKSVNDDTGDAVGIQLKLFRWEKNVVPRIGADPQGVVDEQTREYDIYLGIMSTRFGTSTGKYAETFPASFRKCLPLLIKLRDFWNHLPQTPDCQLLTRVEIEGAIARWVDEKQPGGLTWQVAGPHLGAGSLLLILDGVDEVPLRLGSGRSLCQRRAMLLSGLYAAFEPWSQAGNRVLLTSRPYGIGECDVPIPAGTYRVGDKKLAKEYSWMSVEERQAEIKAPFLLSRYPVTNAQYALFIQEGSY